jgi:hypothetical protein
MNKAEFESLRDGLDAGEAARNANTQSTQVLQLAPPRAHGAVPNSGRALRDLA